MARGFAGRGRGSLPAPKRQILNERLEGQFQALAFLATNNVTGIGTTGLVVTEGAGTLVRTRGSLSVMISVSGTVKNQIQGAFGMIVVSQEAFNAGLASLSTPFDDATRAWFVYEPITMYAVGLTPGGNDQSAQFRAVIDSRGQRKLKEGDVLVTMIELVQRSAVTGTLIDGSYSLRFQFKS